jgi:Leucine-rich repeat (LRR) protein
MPVMAPVNRGPRSTTLRPGHGYTAQRPPVWRRTPPSGITTVVGTVGSGSDGACVTVAGTVVSTAEVLTSVAVPAVPKPTDASIRATLKKLKLLGRFSFFVSTSAAMQKAERALDKREGRIGAWHRKMNARDARVIAYLASSGPLANIETLSLDENQLDDEGMTAFAAAFASAPLDRLRYLNLSNNRIGDEGMAAFASAVANGALKSLETLLIRDNCIGDVGMQAFSTAVASGALPRFDWLELDRNNIGDEGMAALASAAANGALWTLQQLHLDGNKIGDAGVSALAGAVAKGALPNLTHLYLDRVVRGDLSWREKLLAAARAAAGGYT